MQLHRDNRGKIEIALKVPCETADDLSAAYTPGVAAPCLAIADDVKLADELTFKRNTVAVVTDGTAVLGLGDIGPEASLPVMEGKCLLFKRYGNVDAWPICLGTKDVDAIVETVRNIAPGFGGINLEDIAAPRCFEILARLQDLGIPVFHDDQDGTAIATLAALINAAKVVGKELGELRVVISGAGAAGVAVGRILPVGDVILCDRKGTIHSGRTNLTAAKQATLTWSNRDDFAGTLQEAMRGADVFIGVSQKGLLSAEDVSAMGRDPIVLAMANPEPEIMPDEAKAGGAAVVATGRSDFPNQVNNVVVFPGLFRGALDAGVERLTDEMFLAAAHALAGLIEEPTAEKIIPSILDKEFDIAGVVAEAVRNAAAPVTVQV